MFCAYLLVSVFLCSGGVFCTMYRRFFFVILLCVWVLKGFFVFFFFQGQPSPYFVFGYIFNILFIKFC